MEICRRHFLKRELRVLNQKEDRDLQHKLITLEKQYRYTCKMLRQRKDSLAAEERRVRMIKLCEPKATVNAAMKEIREYRTAETHFRRSIYTSDGRLVSCKSDCLNKGSEMAKQSRSLSAPSQQTATPTSSVRRRRNVHSSLSFMQMKNIATIDSISEKELARQQQKAREDLERLRQLQWETLHNRVAAFIQRLKDKGSEENLEEPPKSQ